MYWNSFAFLGVLENENAAYLELPYDGEDQSVTMYVFLPLENTPTAVDELVEKMTTETIRHALRRTTPQKLDVQFPKISLEGNYELNNVSNEQPFPFFEENKNSREIQ